MVGKQLIEARQILERAGFEVDESRAPSEAPVDQVIDQDPNPREKADDGSTVTLEVSGGPGHGARADRAPGCRRRWRSRRSRSGIEVNGGSARVVGPSRRASRSARSRRRARW